MAPIPSECPMHQSNVDKSPALSKIIPSECPMYQSNVDDAPASAPAPTTTVIPTDCPMHANKVDAAVDSSKADINPSNMMPPPNQQPSPGQPFQLDTNRVTSQIPRGGTGKDENWVYPSQQMFWNAMLRKGWRWEKDELDQKDMQQIIRIHNTNNELAWQEVLQWERFRGSKDEDIKLLKFGGKAKHFSPRARFRAAFCGWDLPFDRHDWIVERPDSHQVRYIIDYYDKGDANGYKTGEFIELDVRPAFDSASAAVDRSRAALARWTTGIYRMFGGQTPSSSESEG